MPALQIRVTDEQYKRLSLNAISKGVSQSDLVRGFIDEMPDLQLVQVSPDASSNPATPAQAAAATVDAPALPQAQEEPSPIGFKPVAQRPSRPGFAEELRAKAAEYRLESL